MTETARFKKEGKFQKWKPSPRGEGNEKSNKVCYRCGHGDHLANDSACPAKGQTCRKCNGKDHYAKVCKSKGKERQTVRCVETDDQDTGNRNYAFVVEDDSNTERVTFDVGGVDLLLLIDSGASSNIVDENTWEMLKSKKIKCVSTKAVNKLLYTYSSKVPLPVMGVFKCHVKLGKCDTEAEFTVIQGQGEPLLGRKTAIELGVLRVGTNIAAVTDVKSEIQRQYPKLFKGVGKLNTKQISLHIDESITPVAQPLRRVPFHLREAVEKKVNQLLDMDIIEKVEGPTPWVNPVVVAPKANEDIRMCLDKT